MLEAIKFKLFSNKKSYGIPPLYKILLSALAIIGVVILINKLDPTEAYHR